MKMKVYLSRAEVLGQVHGNGQLKLFKLLTYSIIRLAELQHCYEISCVTSAVTVIIRTPYK